MANRPVDSTYNRALQGTYPPGSSFKVISTAALLRDGLSTEETVNCPTTIDAGGRLFKNFEGEAQGLVEELHGRLSRATARSCCRSSRCTGPRLRRGFSLAVLALLRERRRAVVWRPRPARASGQNAAISCSRRRTSRR